MKTHFETKSAIVLALVRMVNGKQQVLLQRRQNTGFADGSWDLSCSGHVEKGEPMTQTVVRECKEELGVGIDPQNLRFMCLVHKRDEEFDLTYYNGYFLCENFEGVPMICEKEKCSELAWFDIEQLPEDLIDDRRQAILAWQEGQAYLEYGWKKF